MMCRKIGSIVLILCFCLYLTSVGVLAISTSDATKPIDPKSKCSLTVSYCYGETAFSDVQVKLYRFANVSANCYYTLTQSFATTGLVINGIQSTSEWNTVRFTLEAHVVANSIEADAVAVTNKDGQANFQELKAGMYIAVVDQITQDGSRYRFDSVLLSLPGLEQDGNWQYQVTANAKAEALPSVDPDKDIELSILILWKGDEGQDDRPSHVEVDIFRDGVFYETVTITEEDNWTYLWTEKDDGSQWTVVERDVPDGYTVTAGDRENTFVLTNVWMDTDPDTPAPPTGDSFNLMLYVLLMAISGTVLIMVGLAGKRKRL